MERVSALFSLSSLFALAALGCAQAAPASSAPPENAASAGASATNDPAEWVPVATYDGADDATGQRIEALLQAQGIESVAAGSRGFTLSVEDRNAQRARQLVREAIAHDGLRASVLP